MRAAQMTTRNDRGRFHLADSLVDSSSRNGTRSSTSLRATHVCYGSARADRRSRLCSSLAASLLDDRVLDDRRWCGEEVGHLAHQLLDVRSLAATSGTDRVWASRQTNSAKPASDDDSCRRTRALR